MAIYPVDSVIQPLNDRGLECRSNPSSHSRVGDRLVRFSVTDQEAWVAGQRMRFRDVMFDVGYRAKTGVWGE